MPNRARTGHVEVDGVTIFVTRDEKPYSWCAEYELGGSMRNDAWHPRKLRTCNRTYDKLIARVREDIKQHRALSNFSTENPLPTYVGATGILLVATAIGAVVGGLTNEPCNTNTPVLFCGPGIGALFGGFTGFGLTTLGSGVVAIATKNETAKDVAVIGVVSCVGLIILNRLFSLGSSSSTTTTASTVPATPTP